ncbi:hypothetical protein [Streptomyces sp. NPDC087437]
MPESTDITAYELVVAPVALGGKIWQNTDEPAMVYADADWNPE